MRRFKCSQFLLPEIGLCASCVLARADKVSYILRSRGLYCLQVFHVFLWRSSISYILFYRSLFFFSLFFYKFVGPELLERPVLSSVLDMQVGFVKMFCWLLYWCSHGVTWPHVYWLHHDVFLDQAFLVAEQRSKLHWVGTKMYPRNWSTLWLTFVHVFSAAHGGLTRCGTIWREL